MRKGENKLVLDRSTDWRSGEEILLTAGRGAQYEVMQVLNTSHSLFGNNSVIYTAQKFKYTHESEIRKLGGKDIDMRCSVGLLSRNIRVTSVSPDQPVWKYNPVSMENEYQGFNAKGGYGTFCV